MKCFGARPPDSGCAQINRGRQESFVCVDTVELRRLRINLLPEPSAWHSLSLCSLHDANFHKQGLNLCKSSVIDILRKAIYLLPWIDSPICGRKWIGCLSQPLAHSLDPPRR